MTLGIFRARTIKTSKKDIKEGLEEAKSLVEKGWTQDAERRDKQGNAVYDGDDDSQVVEWSMNGAMFSVSIRFRHIPFMDMLETLERVMPNPLFVIVQEWNDEPNRTKEEVLAMFDKAIVSCDFATPLI